MSSLLTKVRRHGGMRRLGKCLEKMAKTGLYRLLGVMSRTPRRASSLALVDVKRVLLVRPNFRLGNAVIGARLAEAFSQDRPEIRIDYLGTDTTAQLFSGMGISNYHAYSRTFWYRPWLFFRMIWDLRRKKYDLAIQVADGSLTSWAFTQLCGAKKTLGQRGRLQNTYDWLVEGKTNHAYELTSTIAYSLGLHCESLPWMVVSEKEHAEAQKLLKNPSKGGVIGVFVGGHLDKRFPLSFWQAQIQELNVLGEKYVVMVGPEEEHYRQYLEQCCGPVGQILPVMPIRQFAAVLSHVITLVTPDTGPMHMGAALGVPTIALLNTEKSRKFCPKGIADKTLFRPTPTEVVAVLSGSPFIQSDRAREEHMLDRRMLLGSF